MSLADDALWKWAEKSVRELPGYKPMEAWRAEMAKRIQ